MFNFMNCLYRNSISIRSGKLKHTMHMHTHRHKHSIHSRAKYKQQRKVYTILCAFYSIQWGLCLYEAVAWICLCIHERVHIGYSIAVYAVQSVSRTDGLILKVIVQHIQKLWTFEKVHLFETRIFFYLFFFVKSFRIFRIEIIDLNYNKRATITATTTIIDGCEMSQAVKILSMLVLNP